MKYTKSILLLILIILSSCKSEQDKIKDSLIKFTQNKVKNPNSVKVYEFQVYDSEDGTIGIKKNSDNNLLGKTYYIEYLFSAKNEEDKEIYRKVYVYIDENKNLKNETYPENIDVENGQLSGSCEFMFGNLITDKGFRGYCKDGNVLIINIDTLNEGKIYRTFFNNGTYEIDDIVPGNYLLKKINRNINLESIVNQHGSDRNFFLIMNIKEIMDFISIYMREEKWYYDKELFDKTLKEIEKIVESENELRANNQMIELFWKDFKKSLSTETISNLEIEEDYKYLYDFKKIEISPNKTTKENLKIHKVYF